MRISSLSHHGPAAWDTGAPCSANLGAFPWLLWLGCHPRGREGPGHSHVPCGATAWALAPAPGPRPEAEPGGGSHGVAQMRCENLRIRKNIRLLRGQSPGPDSDGRGGSGPAEGTSRPCRPLPQASRGTGQVLRGSVQRLPHEGPWLLCYSLREEPGGLASTFAKDPAGPIERGSMGGRGIPAATGVTAGRHLGPGLSAGAARPWPVPAEQGCFLGAGGIAPWPRPSHGHSCASG